MLLNVSIVPIIIGIICLEILYYMNYYMYCMYGDPVSKLTSWPFVMVKQNSFFLILWQCIRKIQNDILKT